MLTACEASLRRLGSDYLDLYLVHWPNAGIPMGETIDALQRLRKDERIRAWGVSNFTIDHLDEALRHGRPSTNQVELHPGLQQPELDDYCREQGIPITAYSPLAKGRAPGNDVLAEIGERHGKSAAQVALRWSLQRGHVVIPKSSSRAHLEANLDVFDFELGPEAMERTAELDRGARILEPSFAEF